MDDSKGSGITFSEQDVRHAKVLMAQLGKVQFTLDIKGVLEFYPSLVWFANFIPAMEKNLLEVLAVVEPVKETKKK